MANMRHCTPGLKDAGKKQVNNLMMAMNKGLRSKQFSFRQQPSSPVLENNMKMQSFVIISFVFAMKFLGKLKSTFSLFL